MNFEKMQLLIKDIISRELMIEEEYNLKCMTEEEKSEYGKLDKQFSEIEKKLQLSLNNDEIKLLDELVDLMWQIDFKRQCYYFERGVRCGFTTLSYLKKYEEIY